MPPNSDHAELNRLFMEVGELVGSLAAVHEKLDSRAVAAGKESDLVQAELRNVNRDLREIEKKHDASVHLLTAEVAGLKKSQDLMAEALKELQTPVKEIVTLRAHAMGALLILGPISAAALYFIPEMWRALWRLVDVLFRNRT
jgi:chromosome segregation ATPase